MEVQLRHHAYTTSSNNCLTDKLDDREAMSRKLNDNETLAIHQLLNFAKNSPLQRKLVDKAKDKSKHYRDFAKATEEEISSIFEKENGGKRNKHRLKESFPIKLYLILERSEIDGYSSIISWASHGRSFRIHSQNLFLKKIMPRFFFQTQMSSFIRQLSTYGFHKIVNENNKDMNCYYHELFLRGREELCPLIMRKKVRSLITAPELEPDFSKFDPMNKLSPKQIPKSSNNNVSLSCNTLSKPTVSVSNQSILPAPKNIRYSPHIQIQKVQHGNKQQKKPRIVTLYGTIKRDKNGAAKICLQPNVVVQMDVNK